MSDLPPPTTVALAIWQKLVEAHDQYISLRMKLFAEHRESLVSLAALGVVAPQGTFAAFELAELLPPAETLPLLPVLLSLCSTQYAGRARSLILAMPRAEVVSAIQRLWDSVLAPHESLHLINLLELFRVLDPVLSKRLARWVRTHPDPEISSLSLAE